MAGKFKNTLGDALAGFWTNYVGWGRATRAEYWWVQLFYVFIAPIVIASVVPELFFVWYAATLVPSFCLTARRLHDTGRSNWNICWSFLPIAGFIILLVFLCQGGNPKANKFGQPRIKK